MRRPSGIPVIDGTALEQTCTDGFKVMRRNADPRCGVISQIDRTSFNADATLPIVAAHRAVQRETRALDAWQSVEPFIKLSIEAHQPVVRVFGERRVHLHDESSI